jgi:hypothetical protein
MKNIIFNETESVRGRNTSDHVCQIFCSKSNCESVYHWCFLLEISVSKLLNNLNVCSSHSYLYPRSRFKTIYMYLITLFIFHCHNVNSDEHRLQQFKPSGQEKKIENWKTRHIWFHFWFSARDGSVPLLNLYACSVVGCFFVFWLSFSEELAVFVSDLFEYINYI